MLAPVPAYADTPGCVSDGEYSNTFTGEKMSEVHARYDTIGWLVDTTYAGGYRYQHRQYVRCPSQWEPTASTSSTGNSWSAAK